MKDKTLDRVLDAEVDELKEKILSRIKKVTDVPEDDVYYKRRLYSIAKLMREKLLHEGTKKQLLQGADFYQKIEAFMDYDETNMPDGKKVITTKIDELIGQMFKSLYINFLLSFLEGEEEFPIPYLGRLKVREIDRFHSILGKNIHFFYGRLHLDKSLRNDLQKIDKEETIEILNEAMAITRRLLTEKIF